MDDERTVRGKRIVEVMGRLTDVLARVPPELRPSVEEIMALIPRLDDGTELNQGKALDANTLRRRNARPVRMMISPALDHIRHVVHDADIIKSDESWTIDMGMSCGFNLNVTLHVKTAGACSEPDMEDSKPVPLEDTTPPPPNDEWEKTLLNLGLRQPKEKRAPRKPRIKPDTTEE
jgi:hypothetical protein